MINMLVIILDLLVYNYNFLHYIQDYIHLQLGHENLSLKFEFKGKSTKKIKKILRSCFKNRISNKCFIFQNHLVVKQNLYQPN